MDKRALRKRLLAERSEFAANEGPFPAASAFRRRLHPGMVVATYMPLAGEVDPYLFNLDVLATLGELALPHVVDRATPLRFLHWRRDGELVRGPFGLLHPPAAASEMVPDVIVTPLIGFDRKGNRLGWGAGHYDRAFAVYPDAWRVGLAYSIQEVDTLPIDSWDVPLHAIATEKEWITP